MSCTSKKQVVCVTQTLSGPDSKCLFHYRTRGERERTTDKRVLPREQNQSLS